MRSSSSQTHWWNIIILQMIHFLQHVEVFWGFINVLHEIEQNQEISMSYLSMVKIHQRKKEWWTLFKISIDHRISLKLKNLFFFFCCKLGRVNEDEFLGYTTRNKIYIYCNYSQIRFSSLSKKRLVIRIKLS